MGRFDCNSNYSIKHVLIDCVDVADIRQNFYNVNNVYDLFANVAGDTILNFFLKKLKYIHKYSYTTYLLNNWFYLFNIYFISTYNSFVL